MMETQSQLEAAYADRIHVLGVLEFSEEVSKILDKKKSLMQPISSTQGEGYMMLLLAHTESP